MTGPRLKIRGACYAAHSQGTVGKNGDDPLGLCKALKSVK